MINIYCSRNNSMSQEDKEKRILKCLLDYVSKSNLKCNTEKLTINKSRYGKPYLAENDDIHFSVSHSNEYWICAVASSQIGVDIEFIKNIDYGIIMNHFFSHYEKEYVRNIGTKAFFEIWCKKESYSKLLGLGLQIPFGSFDVFSIETLVNFVPIHFFSDYTCILCGYNIDMRVNQVFL